MHRTAYYKKKPVWAGIVNRLDGEIEEVVPYRKALFNGFNHSEYFEHPDKLRDSDQFAFFHIIKGPDGNTIITDDWHNTLPLDRGTLKHLYDKLELDDNDYYSDTKDVDEYGLDVSRDDESAIFENLNNEYGWYDSELPSGRKPYDYKYNTLSKGVLSALDKEM